MTSARTYLFSLEHLGIKLGLEQIRALLEAMGRPDLAYRSIIVAGTNGKGSVTALVERGLRAAGYRTGRYTSPHLTNLEERFAVDGRDVQAAELDGVLARVQEAAGHLPAPPSFFEATTAAALAIFADARVDIAVLEVGLGGRLDATNAVAADTSVITAIDFDHQALLGNTIEAIAREKAGVIKPGGLCILARNRPSVVSVVADVCREQNARLVSAVDGTSALVAMQEGRARVELRTPRGRHDVRLGLRGRHQVDNAVAAIRLLEELDAGGRFRIPAAAIARAVEDVTWPGRLELAVVGDVQVLIDGAHNAAGARALAAYLRDTYAAPLPLVAGILRDKDADRIMAALLPAVSRIVCTAPASPRAMPPQDLADLVSRLAPAARVDVAPTAQAAVELAARHGSPVVVAGSLFLAGEVRAMVS